MYFFVIFACELHDEFHCSDNVFDGSYFSSDLSSAGANFTIRRVTVFGLGNLLARLFRDRLIGNDNHDENGKLAEGFV